MIVNNTNYIDNIYNTLTILLYCSFFINLNITPYILFSYWTMMSFRIYTSISHFKCSSPDFIYMGCYNFIIMVLFIYSIIVNNSPIVFLHTIIFIYTYNVFHNHFVYLDMLVKDGEYIFSDNSRFNYCKLWKRNDINNTHIDKKV